MCAFSKAHSIFQTIVNFWYIRTDCQLLLLILSKKSDIIKILNLKNYIYTSIYMLNYTIKNK